MDSNTFLNKVIGPSSLDCWPWPGACNSSGYGTVVWQGKTYTAHRLMAYIIGMVDSPSAPKNRKGGGFVLHTCDNAKCCNPNHFTVGSYTRNQLDAYARSRRQQPQGQHHANAKLTNEQAEEIRSKHKAGVYQATLATEYGISQRAVSKITRMETYV